MARKPAKNKKYTMTISRMTVDKLGVRLYDRVSAVIAELIANAYDADARKVVVEAPMGQLLATMHRGDVTDKGFEIVITDDGIGMTGEEINSFYLKVGAERRLDPRRGDTSRELGRKVMGRKGVGKLAPFGICTSIEVMSSGGKTGWGIDENGKKIRGYETAHLILERDKILQENDAPYHPTVGKFDGQRRVSRGTRLVLTGFSHRHVPTLDDFERQVAQRFGLATSDWKIKLVDNTKTESDKTRERIVGSFNIEKMDDTEIVFKKSKRSAPDDPSLGYVAFDSAGQARSDVEAGFEHEGRFYPLVGWVAYAKYPYKDDLMAGVRIYCRGKIAAQTSIFNRRAGFTGEHDIRSYLIGELHADWLDEAEDLIQTDRRDILWSHELGQAFQKWGQRLVAVVGKKSRTPMKKKAWDVFRETTKIEERVVRTFPSKDQEPIRDNAINFARSMTQNMRTDELEDAVHVEALVELTLNLAPHVTLNEQLRSAADSTDSTLAAITQLLRTARVAELSSFGQIASDRVKVIENVETLKDDAKTLEDALQDLIEEAPWLIDPQWSPVTANQTFATLRREFEKVYFKETGQEVHLSDFTMPTKRSDFVMTAQEGRIEFVEIKKPNYKFATGDLKRLNTYVDLMEAFLSAPEHKEFRDAYPKFHVTLVCDGVRLQGVDRRAFDGLVSSGHLTHISWKTFLLRTKRMHNDFIREAERQKRLGTGEKRTSASGARKKAKRKSRRG